jgi:hypothetical protein
MRHFLLRSVAALAETAEISTRQIWRKSYPNRVSFRAADFN